MRSSPVDVTRMTGHIHNLPAYCLQVLVQNGYFKEALDWIGTDEKQGLADAR